MSAEAGQVHNVRLLDEPFPAVPAAVKILQPVEEDHSFLLNENFLQKILADPKYAEKKVCVIGVAGKFRKGKSFLLNFFLRYLKFLSEGGNPEDDWLEKENSLVGFSWRGGSERDTDGILWWSEPFVLKDQSGEDVVVLLMDTQGAFDSQSTVKDCATVFALSTMISSIQIYNLQNNIHEDDLQHLQLFTEYGRLAMEENHNESKPFQSLVFLVRDWPSPYDMEYGFQGGYRLLESRLQVNDRQHNELQQIRKHIKESFEEIKCFLMPHPGLEVANSPPGWTGDLHVVHQDFKSYLRQFIPRILDPKTLIPKSINGQPVTCRELMVYLKAYIEIFSGEDMPEPKTVLSATAEANNLAATSSAKALYVKKMEEVCGGDSPYISSAELEDEHLRCRNEAIRFFKNAKKMGGTELALQFLERLEQDITEAFESFVKQNQSKNLFKSMRTPAVLVSFMIVNYFCQEILQLIGLDGLASIFSLLLTLIIVALGTWVYSRYSGNIRDIASGIDQSVTWVWENVLSQHVGSAVGVAGQLHQLANATGPANTQKNR